MKAGKQKFIVSVDLDEWYHTRWATGSAISIWKDTPTFFREYYGLDQPKGELIEPTRRTLHLFDDFNIKATFFIQGEVAGYYPDLVKEIHKRGHEIACHGLHHEDLFGLSPQQFRLDIIEAKRILEATIDEPVIGYRAPNLIIEPWAIDILDELGFRYDSSVCPSRSLMGKYSGMQNAPTNPYRLSKESLDKPGDSKMIEIPIPTIPVIKLPAATGIMTRVIGLWWARFGLQHSLQTGPAIYYFHPYEIAPKPTVPTQNPRVHLFLRRCGPWLEMALRQLFDSLDVTYVRACDLVEQLFENK